MKMLDFHIRVKFIGRTTNKYLGNIFENGTILYFTCVILSDYIFFDNIFQHEYIINTAWNNDAVDVNMNIMQYYGHYGSTRYVWSENCMSGSVRVGWVW